MLDSDATDMAEQLASDLGMFSDVTLLELNSGDPADLSEDEVQEIKRELF